MLKMTGRLISEVAGWTCDICVLKFPEDGNSGAETHRGDTYHELCFVICVLLSVFVGQYVELVIRGVQLKSGPYFNMSNLFTKIYNMLYYTANLYLQ